MATKKPKAHIGRPSTMSKIKPGEIDRMISFIRGGAFPYVAAQAIGIKQSTFYDYLGKGRAGDPMYSEFSERVDEAAAEARVVAEVTVKTSNPVAWLKWGPGRERPGQPGWTESVELTGSIEVDVDVEKIQLRLQALEKRRRGEDSDGT